MQRIAFVMHIKPGGEQEYRARHQQVWPALLTDLKAAGCQNYSIFVRGLDIFAYMEVADFQRFLQAMANSEANARWQAFMDDILSLEPDPAIGFPFALEEVFHLD